MFDHQYNSLMSDIEDEEQKEKMRQRGVPEETIKHIFEPTEDDDYYDDKPPRKKEEEPKSEKKGFFARLFGK